MQFVEFTLRTKDAHKEKCDMILMKMCHKLNANTILKYIASTRVVHYHTSNTSISLNSSHRMLCMSYGGSSASQHRSLPAPYDC